MISLWQPYASLLIHGFKINETRPFPCPSLIGQRIGIASTKTIKAEQRKLFANAEFQSYYEQTGLPLVLDDLPHGKILGTIEIASCEKITEETLEEITEEEELYGDWRPGRFAWGTRDPIALPEPVPVMGQQGIWILPDAAKVLLFRPAT